MPLGGLFAQRALKLPEQPVLRLLWIVLHSGSLATPGSCSDANIGGLPAPLRRMAGIPCDAGWIEHALTTLDNAALKLCARMGLQDDMTLVGSAAKLNGAWHELEATLAGAGHPLRSCKCSVWPPGFEDHEDQGLPDAIRHLCEKGRETSSWDRTSWVSCGCSTLNAGLHRPGGNGTIANNQKGGSGPCHPQANGV